MKIHALAATAMLCLAAAGCSTTDNLIGTLSSPQATQAATNVGKIVTAVACGVEAASGSASKVDTQVSGSAQSQQILQTIYVASTAACTLIGGVVQGTAAVPATTITAVTQ